MALGAKTAQRLMNSDRDGHLYSSFFTCTNMYFKFFHSKLHKSPSIYTHPLNISSLGRSYRSLVIWELKMVKD